MDESSPERLNLDVGITIDDHYTLKKRLHGGPDEPTKISEIWLARRVIDDLSVVVKFPVSFGRPHVTAWFMRERDITGTVLGVPNVVKLIGAGRYQVCHPYMVLEYIEGLSALDLLLERQLTSKALDWDEVKAIGLDVCGALRGVHRMACVHRDLKPGNIMIRTDRSSVLTDFGIACRLEDESHMRMDQGNVIGNRWCMSPEQARMELCDQRTDIFGLGATMYVLLSGRRAVAFDEPTVSSEDETLETGTSPPVDMGTYRVDLDWTDVDVSPECKTFIEKAVSEDPEDRFQSAQEMVDELKGLS